MFHRIINTGFYGGISVLLDNLLSCSIFRCIAASRMLKINGSKPNANGIPWKMQDSAKMFIVHTTKAESSPQESGSRTK